LSSANAKEAAGGITDATPLKNGSLPGATQKNKDKKQEKPGGRERGRPHLNSP